MMVEVFKTDVEDVALSERLIRQLAGHFPDSQITFDMEDCDKVLRVAATSIASEKIIAILNSNGYSCEVLA